MKLSFSTLGCPGWSWPDMLTTVKDLGYDGIEIRGIENELYVPKAKPFLTENIEATIEKLKAMNISIPCLTSASHMFDKENKEKQLQSAKEYIDLAQKLNVPYIRVLGDSQPQPENEFDLDFVGENLKAVSEYASQKGVMVLVETNGVFAESKVLLEMLKNVNAKNVGALWDIHHPFRFFNETVSETYSNLKEYIRFVHIKDSVMQDSKVIYKITGQGDVPVKEALLLLKGAGYEGFISLEWVKRWCAELEEPGIVFSKFVNYVRDII